MVVGVAAEGLSHGLGFEGGGEIALEALVQGLLDPAQRLRWQPRETPRERRDLFLELLVGDDLVDEPDAMGLPRVQRLTEHAHLHSSPHTHDARQKERNTCVRDETYLYERHRELRALGSEAEVASKGEPQARPVDRAVRRRDYRLFYDDYPRCKATVGLSEVLPEVEAARVVITLL